MKLPLLPLLSEGAGVRMAKRFATPKKHWSSEVSSQYSTGMRLKEKREMTFRATNTILDNKTRIRTEKHKCTGKKLTEPFDE